MDNVLDELNRLAEQSADLTIRFTTPLHHLSKAGEVLLGQELGVNFKEDVWTCLHPKHINDEWIQCGTCKPCVRNRAAFVMSGVEDPFTYASSTWKIDERMYTQFKLAGDNVAELDKLGVVNHEKK